LAPAEYDKNAVATHAVGTLKIGREVTPDHPTGLNPSTNPDAVNNGSTATGDDGTAAFARPVELGKPGSEYSIDVALSGVTAPATLCAWIDFNGNMVFDNPEERACAKPQIGDQTAKLVWAVPQAVTQKPTYARLRLSYENAAESPTGHAASGEVEDYSVTLTQKPEVDNRLPTTGSTSDDVATFALFVLIAGVFVWGRRRIIA
jgi:LPXTG-motif cell wall-anchored protein